MAQSPPYLGELELFNGWYIQVMHYFSGRKC